MVEYKWPKFFRVPEEPTTVVPFRGTWDVLSYRNHNKDGFSLCGPRVYEFKFVPTQRFAYIYEVVYDEALNQLNITDPLDYNSTVSLDSLSKFKPFGTQNTLQMTASLLYFP